MNGVDTSLLPEGKKRQQVFIKWTSRIIAAASIVALAGIAWWALPYVVDIVENTFQIVVGLWGVALVGGPLLVVLRLVWANRDFLRELDHQISFKLWKWFIERDPIAYIRSQIQKMNDRLVDIDEAIKKLRDVLKKLKILADENINNARKDFEIADNAEDEELASLHAMFAQGKMETSSQIAQSYAEVEDSLNVLQEIRSGASRTIRIMEEDVGQMELNLRVQEARSSAADAARSIIHGDPNSRARMEIANEAYRDRVAAFAANFDQMMDETEPILKAQRVQDIISAKRGKAALEAFRSNRGDIAGLRDFEQQLAEIRRQSDEGSPGSSNQRRSSSPEFFKRKNSGRFGHLG